MTGLNYVQRLYKKQLEMLKNTLLHYKKNLKINEVVWDDGIIVEVDESKFGHRLHNRWWNVDGFLVLLGVEKSKNRRVFFEVLKA